MANAVRALHTYHPRFQDELELSEGDLVTVLQDVTGGWWYGRSEASGKEGWFPSNYVVEPENHAPETRPANASDSDGAHPKHAPHQASAIQPPTSPRSSNPPQAQQQQQQPGEDNSTAPSKPDEDSPAAHTKQNDDDPAAQTRQGQRTQPSQVSRSQSNAPEQPGPSEQKQHKEGEEKEEEEEAEGLGDLPSASTFKSKSPFQRQSLTRVSQRQRSSINAEIEKQLRIRDGAERMLQTLDRGGKAGKNIRRKPSRRGSQQQQQQQLQREEAFLTLSYANSRLQQLRRQLQTLNASVQATARQSVLRAPSSPLPTAPLPSADTEVDVLSMIALGLKETLPVDIAGCVARVLQGHFHVDANDFDPALSKLREMRQFVETHIRSGEARAMLFAYYHQLIHIEHRFCRDAKLPDLHFKWYDTLNGQPCTQASIALEKACVLFNAGALSTQIAAARNLHCSKDLQRAKQEYESAAGTFQFILDNFDNPPSADLSPPFLRFLRDLCLAQAQECIYQWELMHIQESDNSGSNDGDGDGDNGDGDGHVQLPPGEAGAVHDAFMRAWAHVDGAALKDYLPLLWAHLLRVKMLYYEAVADFATATEQLSEIADTAHNRKAATWTGVTRLCRAEELLLRARHVCAAELPAHSGLVEHLLFTLDQVQGALHGHDKDSIFDQFSSKQQLLDMLPTKPDAQLLAQPAYPELGITSHGTYLSQDLFSDVGVVQLFNAWNDIGPLRTISLPVTSPRGLGFVLGGSKPVVVHKVLPDGVAAAAGFESGDVILRIDGDDCRCSAHEHVVARLKGASSDHVTVVVQNIRVRPKSSKQQGSGGNGSAGDDHDNDDGLISIAD
ncbi:hypothetical protein PTSG_07749 [Salpingoeca rosetta]|uniref:Uncharacterized protein n=1 Tax=Salpingoeca rosetta (strain ATCC 50818 / BSB-021) TaxID=946362 RepID=F2UHN8_SALR5|nr:uncharacterized protein PTSG_07749 [Salpingoeca rosetta]EGD76637.1 hypothetical protein PTSG_07749 [Salpingoeca rosetta]|eukprot:XP_004991551.1 hypothetical protein PTSG_07749 [Salpingoeca rosetta]